MIHYSVTRDYSITHLVSRTAFFFFQTTLSILFFLVDIEGRMDRGRGGKERSSSPGKRKRFERRYVALRNRRYSEWMLSSSLLLPFLDSG